MSDYLREYRDAYNDDADNRRPEPESDIRPEHRFQRYLRDEIDDQRDGIADWSNH